MGRQPRIDAPGALHHIMGQGIERTRIFRTDQDREDFLNRLPDSCIDGDLIVYAWVLMPNYFHLLVRTGRQSISKSMRKLLIGYMVNFNLRYQGLSLNFGIWIRDDGWSRFGGTYRIMITLRFRVRHWREIRRVKRESVIGFTGRGVPKIRTVL